MNHTFDQVATAYPLFYRSYSRKFNSRENFEQVIERTLRGLDEIATLSDSERSLLKEQMRKVAALPSGRWMWVGGTPHVQKAENYYSTYNCSSRIMRSWHDFAIMMDLSMQGCGTGTVVEEHYLTGLPLIVNTMNVSLVGQPGEVPTEARLEDTVIVGDLRDNHINIYVGDSRAGWVNAYLALLELSSNKSAKPLSPLKIDVVLSNVRPKGEKLKGFGGVANPAKLGEMFIKIATILNGAHERQINSLEACLLLGEAALVVVAGNIRRSAAIRQGSPSDQFFTTSKDNLWNVDENGVWSIDPKRDSLRMANHTSVYHAKPTRDECIESVRKQYYSGEGAIQWAREAIARANGDILDEGDKEIFLNATEKIAPVFLWQKYKEYCDRIGIKDTSAEFMHRSSRYALNPCAEVIGSNFQCNLAEVHLNQLDHLDLESQTKAFQAASIAASVLLHHEFPEERFRQSREWDPIIQVSITGLFDFFVKAFGKPWLLWWKSGRSRDWSYIEGNTHNGLYEAYEQIHYSAEIFLEKEKAYLVFWRGIVEESVANYCIKHNLRIPNRTTGVQPAGSKSLLTGASAGWHPPKAIRYIRRMTFAKDDPIALACIDYGYTVTPSQSDTDENGVLLSDPFDPRCTEWLVEMPVEVSWAAIADEADIDPNEFSALAQFDFYMQVQRHYTTHNTSATIELRADEIESLGDRIYQAIQSNEGYISAALLARMGAKETYPRMPFEPISNETYQEMVREMHNRRKSDDFHALLAARDAGSEFVQYEQGAAPCDSDKCLMPEGKNLIK